MNHDKKVMRISQGLIFLNALIWIIAGIAGLLRSKLIPGIPSWIIVVMSIGMMGYGAILFGLGIGLGTRKRFFYYASLAMIALSVILPVFDDFGLADLLAVIPAAATMVYLILNKPKLISKNVE